jgi:hypothetical protein
MFVYRSTSAASTWATALSGLPVSFFIQYPYLDNESSGVIKEPFLSTALPEKIKILYIYQKVKDNQEHSIVYLVICLEMFPI